MASQHQRNQCEGQGVRRSCKEGKSMEKTGRGRRKIRVAMVPARCFSGTPEFVKGVVGRWGKTISFEDHGPFFF